MSTIDCPKCEHEHEPTGCHETDSGEWECEECGFVFHVHIDYEPEYSTSCDEHEYGEPELHRGDWYRLCKHCSHVKLIEHKEDATA